jgi:homospermidine synthase
VIWTIKNPNRGICIPDDIDHREILKTARPYLGEFVSQPTDWLPTSGENKFLLFGKNVPHGDDMWQFSTFLVKNEFYKG